MSSPPAYLTEYLNQIAKNEGFVEHTLHYESGSNHGDGFVAVMVAVTIKGKQTVDVESEKKLSLMCKLLPENRARREFFNSTLLFEREVCVYSHILPMFEQFQHDRNICSSDGFFQYPKCYLAVADAGKDHYVIVMENVKVSNYELWDKMKPVDFDTSSIFLQTLGRYHGISYALRDQKPELFKELLDLDHILTAMVESPNISNMMLGAMDKAVEHLTCDGEKNILRNLRENYKQSMAQLFAPNAAGQLAVLLHGDCWNNNFCFKTDANIESLDDNSGRLLIKLALGSTKDWFNEFMVQAVSKAEYAQYGKVLNYAKYEEYKKKQEDKERLDNLKIEKTESSESTSKAYQRHRQRSDSSSPPDEANDRRISSSKSRPHQQHSDKHAKHRDRSNSTSDDDRRKTDRTSKYHSSRRDSSPETSTRKSKNPSTRKSSDDSDSDRRAKHSSSSRSTHKKTKSKKHFKSRSYSKDHRQRYHSSDDEDKHYNKKTKKSKRARSRSRDRR